LRVSSSQSMTSKKVIEDFDITDRRSGSFEMDQLAFPFGRQACLPGIHLWTPAERADVHASYHRSVLALKAEETTSSSSSAESVDRDVPLSYVEWLLSRPRTHQWSELCDISMSLWLGTPC
jgi:hypothetical protein